MDEIAQLLKQQNLQQKELLTFEEGCDFLGFKPSYMYKLTSSNEIPYYTPSGRKIIFTKAELTEWALRNRNATRDELVEQTHFINRKSYAKATFKNI